MKILGIGNAIVDVICKVDENFIKDNSLTKGTMKLIFEEKEFQSLLIKYSTILCRLKISSLFVDGNTNHLFNNLPPIGEIV